MSDMNLLKETQDLNLNYLMLAKNMISESKEEAMFRLGISYEMADILGGLSTAQMLKLSSSTNLVMRFRFDDAQVLDMVTSHAGEHELSRMRVPVLLSSQEPSGITK